MKCDILDSLIKDLEMPISKELLIKIIFMKYVDPQLPYNRIVKALYLNSDKQIYHKTKVVIRRLENRLFDQGLSIKKIPFRNNILNEWMFSKGLKSKLDKTFTKEKISEEFARQSSKARLLYVKETYKNEITTLKRLVKKFPPFKIAKIISKITKEPMGNVSRIIYYFVLENGKYGNVIQLSLNKLKNIFSESTLVRLRGELDFIENENKELEFLKKQTVELLEKMYETFPTSTIGNLINSFLPKKLQMDRQLYQNIKNQISRFRNTNRISNRNLHIFHEAILNTYEKYYKPLISDRIDVKEKLKIINKVVINSSSFYWPEKFFKIFLEVIWSMYSKTKRGTRRVLPSRIVVETDLGKLGKRIVSYVDRKYNGWISCAKEFGYVAESDENVLNSIGMIFQDITRRILCLKSNSDVHSEVSLNNSRKRLDHVAFIPLSIGNEKIKIQVIESKLTLTTKRLLEIYHKYAFLTNPLSGEPINKIMVTDVRRQGIDTLTNPLKKLFDVDIIKGEIPTIRITDKDGKEFRFFLISLDVLKKWIKKEKEFEDIIKELENLENQKWSYFLEKYQSEYIQKRIVDKTLFLTCEPYSLNELKSRD